MFRDAGPIKKAKRECKYQSEWWRHSLLLARRAFVYGTDIQLRAQRLS